MNATNSLQSSVLSPQSLTQDAGLKTQDFPSTSVAADASPSRVTPDLTQPAATDFSSILDGGRVRLECGCELYVENGRVKTDDTHCQDREQVAKARDLFPTMFDANPVNHEP